MKKQASTLVRRELIAKAVCTKAISDKLQCLFEPSRNYENMLPDSENLDNDTYINEIALKAIL